MTQSARKSHEQAAPRPAEDPLAIGMLVGSVSRTAGGVGECLRALSRALHAPPACRVAVFSLTDRETSQDLPAWAPVPVHLSTVAGPAAFGFAPELARSVERASLDLLHIHGLWMYPSIVARRWAARQRAPYIVSPHGMLDPWALANSGWKKTIAARLYEQGHLRNAACIHALCEAELEAIRAFGLKNPVCVIRNGIDPVVAPPAEPAVWRHALPREAKILLFLGRVTPKKGLVNLIRAWDAVRRTGRPDMSPWHLVIAGWSADGHAAELESLTASLDLRTSVHFVGPQHGPAKEATLAAADAFVLPSVSEGLPMAVLEAWAHALPVLMTPQCNLPEGFAHGAALSANPDVGSLTAGLASLCGLSKERLRTIGQAGLRLTREHFTWPAVAAEFGAVYRWLTTGGPRPASIDLW
jgi:poly(glycerol-phosphate) alpha-glucosyltransferase